MRKQSLWRWWKNNWRKLEGFARLEFVPQDLWVGVYWDLKSESFVADREEWEIGFSTFYYALHVYICALPCLPLHVTLRPYCKERYEKKGDAPRIFTPK